MKLRYLITTALEESWKSDIPVLFLGEWARRYDRRCVWQSMDAIVASPYGMDNHQRERDFEYIQALTLCLLGELSNGLNSLHNVQYSKRQWQVILGHWLSRYVSIAFNRYFTLERALNDYEISGTTVLEFSDYSLASYNSLEFVRSCNDDVWNHVFFSRVLQFLGAQEVHLHLQQAKSNKFTQPTAGSSPAKSVRSCVIGVGKKILSKLCKKNDAFIVSSYLPFKEEIKWQLSLGQCPQLWSSPKLTNFKADKAQRKFLIDASRHEKFERFVREMLSDVIPSCYVEGFPSLSSTVKSLSWPVQPKFIYTANSFDTDEVFKVWTANKIADAVPYYIGQHGAGYGTHKYFQTKFAPECVASDKFLTWGWTDNNPKNIPAFVFLAVAQKPKQYNPKGNLLLIEASPPHQLTHWDSYFEYGVFLEEQFRFVEALPCGIHQQLVVRLHGGYKNFNWSVKQRWEDRSPTTKIDNGSENIKSLIGQSRLVVHAYDSTGILEGLSLNIPTLCFWHGGLEHLLPEAWPYYQLLMDAGILLDSPEQVAKRVAMVWDDIDGWWAQSAIQEARKKFCDQYARVSKNPIRDLNKLLQE